MISLVLFFFAVTLVYTGFLVSVRDLAMGIAIACAGLILIIKPVREAARDYMTHSGGNPVRDEPRNLRKKKPKKVYLNIVKSEDDRPTIH